ncbi:MAG: hypothetical protein R3B49_03030 [Phycisphaerales bacterium]
MSGSMSYAAVDEQPAMHVLEQSAVRIADDPPEIVDVDRARGVVPAGRGEPSGSTICVNRTLPTYVPTASSIDQMMGWSAGWHVVVIEYAHDIARFIDAKGTNLENLSGPG